MGGLSVFEHVGGQLTRLCEVAGVDPDVSMVLLKDLLGPVGTRRLSEPPAWPSNVADDHTPVEFSMAYSEGEPPSLRVLGEATGSPPGVLANQAAAHRFLRTQAHRFNLSTSQFDQVKDLFATDHPQGEFTLLWSLVFHSRRQPELKVYFNPEVKGVRRAPELVAEALHQLGLATSYQSMLDCGVRPGELGQRDRLTFLALDLHGGPRARVKLYLTHHDAEARDVVRAAGAVDDIDVAALAEFCAVAGGGITRFDRHPLVASYTLTEGSDKPMGYSLYVPIRSYVHDDDEARDRVTALLARHNFDGAAFDRAIAAVTQRALRAGVGLLAHVSLRLGKPRPGVTVYLSSEAYQVHPPHPRPVPATRNPPVQLAGQTAA